MAKNKKPGKMAVARYGMDIATLKANLGPKKWRRLVKMAHSQGHTVAGQLSSAPNALKERTNKSIAKEARRTIAAAYRPVLADISRRETANNFLAQKRQEDDAAFRTWLMGETDKLDAQARAADTALASQQSDIASDLNDNQKAAQADSLQRVAAAAGNVSDPSQSKALDFSAADQHSREQVANQRQLTADMMKIGGDANQVSRAAMLATAAAREATRKTEVQQAANALSSDRTKVNLEKAAATADLRSKLKAANVETAQRNREFDLAAGELGFKQQSLAADVKEANQKFRLANKKFDLDKWKAKNQDALERAKIELGYDQIAAQDGRAAADRALRKWVEKYKARQALKRKDEKHGVDSDERKLYRTVNTVQGLYARMQGNKVDPDVIRQRLRKQGFDDPMIDLAQALWINSGSLNPDIREKAKKIGILHPGYFW